MSSGATPSTAAASKAQRTAAAAAYHAARHKVNGGGGNSSLSSSSSSSSSAAAKSVDPVEAALKKITSTSESYDDFVRSFGETDIQRLDANGENALTTKSHPKRKDDHAEPEADADESSSSIVATAPSSSSTSSSSTLASSSAGGSGSGSGGVVSSSSDFLTLMRMLAEDKAKYAGSTRIITGDEQDEHDPRSHPAGARRPGSNGFDPAMAAAFQGSHIRVDDSYGFAPDPFAPESRPGASGDNDEEDDGAAGDDDPAERHARIRVLGDDEASDSDDAENSLSIASRKMKSRAETTEESEEAEEGGESDGSASAGVESNLFLTEEDAGASLESEPVPDDYLYDSQKDAMSYHEFQQQKQQKLQQQREKQLTSSTSSSLPSLTKKEDSQKSPRAESSTNGPEIDGERPDPATANARAASRLAADEAVAARQQHAVNEAPASDEVESFLYNPLAQNDKAVVAEFSDSDEERDAEDMRRRNLAAITREKRIQEAVTAVSAGSSTSSALTSASSSSSSSAPSSSTVSAAPAASTTAKPAVHESDFIIPPPRNFSNSNTTARPIPGGSATTSSTSGNNRAVSKPLAELDDDVVPSMDDEIETVDLEGESSTSVPIFANIDSANNSSAATSSTSAGLKAPSKVHIGNFLSAKDRLGFDEDLPSTPEADSISTDEEAEWIEGEAEMQATINSTTTTTANAASAIVASAAANASSYVPSNGPRQKRSLLK